MRKTWILNALLALSLIPSARADYWMACGDNREGGPRQAELAIEQDMTTLDMRVILNGKKLPLSRATVKGADNYRWIINVREAKDGGARSFELREKAGTAQEIGTDEFGRRKKIGAALKCEVHEDDAEDAESGS